MMNTKMHAMLILLSAASLVHCDVPEEHDVRDLDVESAPAPSPQQAQTDGESVVLDDSAEVESGDGASWSESGAVDELEEHEELDDLVAPLDPSFAESYKYRIKFESLRSLHCGKDVSDEKPCAVEEPFVVWCMFWPGGSGCGVTNYVLAQNIGDERLLSGMTSQTTGYNPSKVAMFFQVIEADGGLVIGDYVDALETARTLIQPAIDWNNVQVNMEMLASIWNHHTQNGDHSHDDDLLNLITRVPTLANLQSGTVLSGKFLSDCAYPKLPSQCAGSYSQQWMGYNDDPGQYRVAFSISAVP